MDPQITELVDFYIKAGVKAWFTKDDKFDETLRTKYSDLVQQARTNDLDSLESTAEGSLALIILLDQIPRNIFRGSAESFSSDEKAQGIATRSIARNFDQEMGAKNPSSQLIFYLPLMHAEDVLAQIACRALLQNALMKCDQGSEEKVYYEAAVKSAQGHLECILHLGLFPARNDALGREHRDVDRKFLEEHPGGW